MNYRTEDRWAAFFVPCARLGSVEARYILAAEGCDECARGDATGQQPSVWEARMVGSYASVMRQVVSTAGDCESGILRPHGRRWQAETYIRRVGQLIFDASRSPAPGSWRARLRAAPDHPAVASLRRLGLEPCLETHDSVTTAVVEPKPEHLGAYFELIDRHADDLPAWCWIEVHGLPRC
jgi:hypothetical protein